jgi:CRP/FNR family transcriptional regulator, cyclic AMP receptor protein
MPYALPILDSCMLCALRNGNFFCALPPASLKALERVKHSARYPEDTIIFMEGQDPEGVYILCEGKVRLQTANGGGRPQVLRIAHPGDVLGLQSTITSQPYELTAQSATPVQLAFVGRRDFGRFLRTHGEACIAAARQLSRNGHDTFHMIPSAGLSHSMTEKLAKQLLQWSAEQPETYPSAGIRIAFTHDELARLIGSSTETVARLLQCFASNRILELNGSSLRILNKFALERLVGT